jgi:hypothetical protein
MSPHSAASGLADYDTKEGPEVTTLAPKYVALDMNAIC